MRTLHPWLITAIVTAAVAAHPNQAVASDEWRPSTAKALVGLFDGQSPSLQTPSDPAPAIQVPKGPEVHPEPAHTGFRALAKDTLKDFKAFPKRRSTWVILGLGAGLAAVAHPADEEFNQHLIGSKAVKRFFAPGHIVGATYTQVGVSLGLYAIGRYLIPPVEGEPRTNKVSHLGFDLLRAQIVSQTIVHAMKPAFRRDRPTGECCAFPSGHAASVFAAAAVLERHLGYRFAWPTLVGATYVGMSRLHDNRHFLSDVVFGAAVGTATGWTIVGRHGRDSYAFVPMPVPGGVALMLTRGVN